LIPGSYDEADYNKDAADDEYESVEEDMQDQEDA